MLILGNKNQQQILKDFLERFRRWEIKTNFLLLEGEKHIWKTTLIEKLIRDFLGNYFITDFLYIKDLSEKLWKKHFIKVESDEVIKIDDEEYIDYGIRQIQDWINKTSFWKFKVVFLENIERMTLASANAMLKTFEELPTNRLIIATTTNRSKLLDTIVSRAFVIRFNLLTEKDFEQIEKFISPQEYEIFKKYEKLLLSITFLRPGLVINLIRDIIQNRVNVEDILADFEKFIKSYEERQIFTIYDRYNLLKNIYESWNWELFLNFLTYYFYKKNKVEDIRKLYALKQKFESNVNVENLLLYFSI